MDLSTTYMGLTLRSPLVPSASPLSESVDTIRELEDAGAAAIVLHSLFEEQLRYEELELHHYMEYGSESFAEALSYFPEPGEYRKGPDEYLEHIRRTREAVGIPVIASLNASRPGSWMEFARRFEEAGAHAIELNIYFLPTDIDEPVREIEQTYVDVVREVAGSVGIPVAVKLHPFFTSVAHMAHDLERAGARGLALFNRFYQPDIDPENLEVFPNLKLSSPYESRLALRWIAILHGRISCDLAATGGVHHGRDAIKLLMAGARVTHLCSALLKYGVGHLRRVEEEIATWLEENEYGALADIVGVMSQKSCPDPRAFERANYIRMLQSYA
ncbi:MAG: dihydroorotate dehydrogenase-like protein [Acidobacteriota bacterium]|nr:MAG: dihydroorotate dehydrogenase-like protein [Acidobacteriota bacterium]